jgi:hypothetical protein
MTQPVKQAHSSSVIAINASCRILRSMGFGKGHQQLGSKLLKILTGLSVRFAPQS